MSLPNEAEMQAVSGTYAFKAKPECDGDDEDGERGMMIAMATKFATRPADEPQGRAARTTGSALKTVLALAVLLSSCWALSCGPALPPSCAHVRGKRDGDASYLRRRASLKLELGRNKEAAELARESNQICRSDDADKIIKEAYRRARETEEMESTERRLRDESQRRTTESLKQIRFRVAGHRGRIVVRGEVWLNRSIWAQDRSGKFVDANWQHRAIEFMRNYFGCHRNGQTMIGERARILLHNEDGTERVIAAEKSECSFNDHGDGSWDIMARFAESAFDSFSIAELTDATFRVGKYRGSVDVGSPIDEGRRRRSAEKERVAAEEAARQHRARIADEVLPKALIAAKKLTVRWNQQLASEPVCVTSQGFARVIPCTPGVPSQLWYRIKARFVAKVKNAGSGLAECSFGFGYHTTGIGSGMRPGSASVHVAAHTTGQAEWNNREVDPGQPNTPKSWGTCSITVADDSGTAHRVEVDFDGAVDRCMKVRLQGHERSCQ